MIYLYRCKSCDTVEEKVERVSEDHSRSTCPSCGTESVRLFTPSYIVYKGNPRGFSKKESESEKRLKEANRIADHTYKGESETPPSKNESFWQDSATRFGTETARRDQRDKYRLRESERRKKLDQVGKIVSIP